MPRDGQWCWPREASAASNLSRRAVDHAAFRPMALPEGVKDNHELRRAAITHPGDDEPRRAYAAWMRAQDHEFAQLIGAFISAQLRVAESFREAPLADVAPLRRWSSDPAFVSTVGFRAGDTLRPWFLDDLSDLMAQGLVGWPQVYRGFVERVSLRASRFLELADELFCRAPIRYLVLVGVPRMLHRLVASPHLKRIRSLSLPRHNETDELSDDDMMRLVGSPHLRGLVHLRLVDQGQLTARAYEHIVTADTLPMLSSLEIYAPPPEGRRSPDPYATAARFERMIANDSPWRVARSKQWVTELERAVGYVPCVHPDQHYGRNVVDIEAVVAHPIALDARIMRRRGAPVPVGPVQEDRQ